MNVHYIQHKHKIKHKLVTLTPSKSYMKSKLDKTTPNKNKIRPIETKSAPHQYTYIYFIPRHGPGPGEGPRAQRGALGGQQPPRVKGGLLSQLYFEKQLTNRGALCQSNKSSS